MKKLLMTTGALLLVFIIGSFLVAHILDWVCATGLHYREVASVEPY